MQLSQVDSTSLRYHSDVSLADFTTLGVGGNAMWLVKIDSFYKLQQAQAWAAERALPILYMGDGSNMLFSDRGFRGLVIQNGIQGCESYSDELKVGGGTDLNELIRKANSLNLAGMECMYGIPGTVAGALVGNAGAYGQEIGDVVTQVSVWSGSQIQILTAADLQFNYRHSVFKTDPHQFILQCQLSLTRSPKKLQKHSDEILSKRHPKYPPGLRCPGSFFKNIPTEGLTKTALEKVEHFVMFDKVPAGRLLEAVGANGSRRGDAQIAPYHGNLIMNTGRATTRDILWLANLYAGKVWERFQVRLEPEILIVDNNNWPYLHPGGQG